MDVAGLREAGLYDPDAPGAADRLALLEWLAEQGATLDEMRAAHESGRLFGLAGDRIIRPGRDTLSLRDLAAELGADVEIVRALWRTLGLTEAGPDSLVASPDDRELIGVLLGVAKDVGPDASLAFARVWGSAMSRVAEAESAALRPDRELSLDTSGSELVTARRFARAAAVVPAIGRALDLLHRHHLDAARRHFEMSDSGDVVLQHAVRFGVGFADLTNFTGLAQTLELSGLAQLLVGLEDEATAVVSEGGGRVVKYLGDAVMFVAPRPEALALIALGLVGHGEVNGQGISVRAGLSYGPLLAQEGDYFGHPVNLAARLVALAEPGTVLADGELAGVLADQGFTTRRLGPLEIRGYAEAIEVVAVEGAPE